MSAQGIAEIAWTQLGIAATLLLVALALSVWQRLGLASAVVLGGVRATVQLILVAQVLRLVFQVDRPQVVLLVLAVMTVFAAVTAVSRAARSKRMPLVGITSLGLLLGSGLTLAYVDLLVIPIEPWYNPRYLIPMYGMVLANAMNAAALGAERLGSEIDARRAEIEALLALGASVAQASATPVRRALTAAMTPAINALSVVGVVSLPGMMTGQIIAGADPTLAVRYQLVIVFMLASASALAAAVVVLAYRRRFFTHAAQLRPSA
jgi:putative ABC transport system permease protein